MTDAVDVIAASMRADAEALRTIGGNIANAQSVAYRREIPLARVDFAQLAAQVAQGGELSLPQLGTSVDLRPGTLQRTGEHFDLAIEGRGFFVVKTVDKTLGGEKLTRRGDFRLDADGYLVTQTGDAVLGEKGPVRIGGGQAAIATDGTVRVDDQVVDRLRIVEVETNTDLQPASDGAYLLTGGQMTESSASRVQQGFLETSNVESVNEMIRLMETMRRFETSQRFFRGYDDMIEKAISTLGKV